MPVYIGQQEIVVVRDGDEVFAFPDMCTHARRPLSDGEYEDGVVTCIYHGATFDLRREGKATLPALRALSCLVVEVREGEVWVGVG